MSHDENFQRWIEEVMSKIIKNLGPNVSNARYELSDLNSNFMSTTYNVSVTFDDEEKSKSVNLPIILKKCPNSEHQRMLNSDRQFHNENLFYRMYALPEENFPKCLYVDQLRNSVIALENVRMKSYRTLDYMCDAPLEYTLAAMRELGRFHGKGYAMKVLQREKFFSIVNQLQEVRYYKEEENRMEQNTYKIYTSILASHGVKYLRRQGHDPLFCDQMEALLSDAYDRVIMKIVQPVEPLSTLCHGDFTLGNILFRTADDGKYHGMLIDFALITYATPVIDLSTFLYICCSNDTRKDKLPEILRAYHDALKEYLEGAGVWNDEKYSYDNLLDNYKWGALFGFIIASYYLVIAKGYFTFDAELLSSMGPTEYVKLQERSTNDEISKTLADMLLELKSFGCLTNFS